MTRDELTEVMDVLRLALMRERADNGSSARAVRLSNALGNVCDQLDRLRPVPPKSGPREVA